MTRNPRRELCCLLYTSNIKGPAAQDICYATENRQVAVKQVASEADLLLVVGSENSSNSNRLVEVARNLGTTAHLIDSYNDIESEWLVNVKTIALTAGASAPECLVEETMKYLASKGFDNVQELEVMPENVQMCIRDRIEAVGAAEGGGGGGGGGAAFLWHAPSMRIPARAMTVASAFHV